MKVLVLLGIFLVAFSCSESKHFQRRDVESELTDTLSTNATQAEHNETPEAPVVDSGNETTAEVMENGVSNQPSSSSGVSEAETGEGGESMVSVTGSDSTIMATTSTTERPLVPSSETPVVMDSSSSSAAPVVTDTSSSSSPSSSSETPIMMSSDVDSSTKYTVMSSTTSHSSDMSSDGMATSSTVPPPISDPVAATSTKRDESNSATSFLASTMLISLCLLLTSKF